MKRIVFLDYVRVIACFLVMLVHASENYYGVADSSDMAGPQSFLANETDRLWVSLYDGMSRMAVPLFMIVSAFLLVPMKDGITAFNFYKKRAKRILPAFIFFMIIYSTVPMFWNQLDIESSLNDLANLPLNFPSLAGHLWFIYPLIGLYLFIPIISPWLTKVSKKEERFFVILFVLSTCIPYLNRIFGEVWGQCFWNEFHTLWYFSGYLGYLVLAHYIRVHLDWGFKKRLFYGILLFISGGIITVLSFYLQAVPGIVHSTPYIELGWSFCTVNCVMLTTGAFLMFTCIKKERTPVIIAELSKLSYGMYLIHILWLGLWVSLFKDTLNLPSPYSIPAIAVATFICCWLSTKLISLIPGCQWMIGVNKEVLKNSSSKNIVFQ